jgi:hypothetical protein
MSQTTMTRTTRLPRGAERLPPEARAKLLWLQEAATVAGDANNAAYQRQLAALEELRTATDLRDELAQALAGSGKRDDQQMKALHEAVTSAQAAARRWSDLAEKTSEAASPIRQLLARTTAYIEAHSDTIEAAPPVASRSVKGTPTLQLHDLRLQIATLLDRRRDLRDAPPPDSEIAATINAAVDELAAMGRPYSGEPIGWRTTAAQVSGDGRAITGHAQIPNAPATLAWLFPDALKARLLADRMAERQARGVAPGLPVAEREAALVKVEAELLEAERREEALIDQLAAAGTLLPRRETADPRAVLGIAGPAPEVE